MSSDGTLNIGAAAVANGTSGAFALASVSSAISQSAYAYNDGNAANTVAVGTAGAINIDAVATAGATAEERDASAFEYLRHHAICERDRRR